ncbi:MAG: hypothetical protein LBH43_18870 [Treponema sp.]|nr:hypothetical protein [Treponema sp.]
MRGILKALGIFTGRRLLTPILKPLFANSVAVKTHWRTAGILNGTVIPLFDSHGIPLLRILTGRVAGIAGTGSAAGMRSVLIPETLIVPRQKLGPRELTEPADGSRKHIKTGFMQPRPVKKRAVTLTGYSLAWING